MLQIVMDCANIHCPIVDMIIPSDSPVWFTEELVDEIHHKDYLYQQAKFEGNEESWKIFQKKKKDVKRMLQYAKEGYIKEHLETQQTNPRKIWRNINKITGLGKTGKKGGLKKVKMDDGTVIDNQGAADYINEFYVNTGPNLARKFDDVWDSRQSNIDVNSRFIFIFITAKEITNLVRANDICKSSAVENLRQF